MDKIHLEAMSGHMKKIVVGNRDQGITKNKSRLTNFFVFCDEIPGCPLKGREVDVVHVDFNRVLDVILHRIFTAKLVRYGLDKWT